jgi:Recombination endonuclease VII
MRLCGGCDQKKSLSEFGFRFVKGKKYSQSYCTRCRRLASMHTYYQKTIGKKKEYNHKHYISSAKTWNLLKKFGITAEQKDQMIREQGNKCPICKIDFEVSRNIHVDHDHKTGKIRAILCSTCNQLLGLAHDNPNILILAAAYLTNRKKGLPLFLLDRIS